MSIFVFPRWKGNKKNKEKSKKSKWRKQTSNENDAYDSSYCNRAHITQSYVVSMHLSSFLPSIAVADSSRQTTRFSVKRDLPGAAIAAAVFASSSL